MIYEHLHGFVVLQLLSDRRQVLFSDELRAPFSFPGETDLVVRAMLLRWGGLASASGRAAYVELSGKTPWAQVSQRGELPLHFLNLTFDFNFTFGVH